jgi:colanic acid biosynthesis glycosyl transferase WcaI
MADQRALRGKILVMTQFFPPETGAASVRTAAVVRELGCRGYDVTVVAAFPSFPSGVIEGSYRGRSLVEESFDGVRIIRLWTYASPRLSKFDRILNWLTFGASLAIYLFVNRQRPDFIYVSVPPLSLMPLAVLAKRLYGAPLIADVRDVLPDRALHLEMWKRNGLLTRFVGFVASRFYAWTDLIATLNETCRDEIIARCDKPDKVIVFPNGFDPITPTSVSPYQRSAGEFVASYAGNIGMTSGVDVILDAAEHLKQMPRFRLLIIGGGNERAKLESRIKKDGLTNVTMLGPRTAEDAASAQLESDLCIVPLRKGVPDTIPKKLYDALALGRPVVVCANGEAARFIDESGGGVCINPEDGLSLAGAIRRLAEEPKNLELYGRKGREFVAARYSRAQLVQAFVEEIIRTTSRNDSFANTGSGMHLSESRGERW